MNLEAPWRITPDKVLVFWGIAAIFAVSLLLVHTAAQALLLTFAGILFGTALRGLAEWLAGKLGWPPGWSLVLCVVVLLALSAGVGLWIVPHIAAQSTTLVDKLGEAYETLRQRASQSELGSRILNQSATIGQQLSQFAMRAAGMLASVIGAVGALVFVFFLALYGAASPELYRRGIVALVPQAHRGRAREVLEDLATTLRRWLLGRLISMTAVGCATALGLWIIGIPLPVTLGLLAGALGFVPNIGPLVSAVPAVLLALTVSSLDALYVLILYLAINLADGYVLTPWVQKRAVSVPPGLILTAQVVLGAVWGVLGVTLATPIVACLLVLTRKLYVEGVLERPHASAD